MNHIYKVIWSKTKHRYVVVSELAKRTDKGSTTRTHSMKRAVTTLAVAAALGLGGFGSVSMAAYDAGGGTATGTNSVAVGEAASAAGQQSVAIGSTASVTGGTGVAIGCNANANAGAIGWGNDISIGHDSTTSKEGSISIGAESASSGVWSTALGTWSNASGDRSIALGNMNNATGNRSVALGNGANATDDYSMAMGNFTTAAGKGATALGNGAASTGLRSTALGNGAAASSDDSTALGAGASAAGQQSVSLGYTASAAGQQSVAIGSTASATGGTGVAIGSNANANAGAIGWGNDISIGHDSTTSKEGSISIGAESASSGVWSTALGTWSNASGDRSIALGNMNNATGNRSVALGNGANATDDYSMAMGNFTTAAGKGATALGNGAASTGLRSTALGNGAAASSDDSTALGAGASAAGQQSVSLGYTASAAGQQSVAIGSTASATGGTGVAIGSNANANAGAIGWGNDISIGHDSTTSKEGSISIGAESASSGVWSTALGTWSNASGDRSIALGNMNNATGNRSVALGNGANATDDYSMAMGNFTTAAGKGATALGNGAASTGLRSTALGNGAAASSDDSTALGAGASAAGNRSVSLGYTASAAGQQSVAIGSTASATDDYSMAMGNFTTAAGKGATALGNSAASTGLRSTALGNGAAASSNDSVALGSGSVATSAGTDQSSAVVNGITYDFTTEKGANKTATNGNSVVSVGSGATDGTGQATRQIINVANGEVSSTSTDAINGSQLYSVANQVGTNAKNIATNATNITNLTNNVNSGWEADVNGTKLKSVTPSSPKLNFVQGSNMVVTGSGDNVTIATSTTPTFTSATVGGVNITGGKVTNLTAGTADTDAVNYSQIKDLVNTDGSTKTLTFAANSGTAFKSNPDSTITVKGTGTKDDSSYSSDNIKTVVDTNGNITVMMDKELTSDTLTVGQDGKDGTIGVNGADGISGVGIDGKDGISIKGADGKDGVTIYSKDGDNGSEGHIGLTGPAGADGKNATADISVKDGAAGVDGTTLTRVVYEDRNGKEHQVATLDDGMKYDGDTGTGLAMKLNSTVNVKGGVTDTANLSDNNIGVVSDGTDTLSIKLAKDLSGLTSATFDSGVKIGKDGIDAGSKTITGVATPVNGTDAANKDYVDSTAASSDTHVKSGTYAVATSGTDKNTVTLDMVKGNTDLTDKVTITGVATTADLKNLSGDTTNAVLYDGTAKDTVTLAGASGTTITNVAKGVNDTDAVNYSQIKDLVNTDGSTKTLTFAANSGTAFKSNPDSTITVKGTGTKDDSNYSSENIKTTVDADGNITVMMDKDISAGTIGVAGKDGKDGVTIYATDGKDGSEGHIGLTGPAGADGKNATADISVKDGAAGVDGTTLTRVVYEDRNGKEHQVATLDDGMKYDGDTGTGLAMKLNSTVNVKGGVTDTANLSDNNIGVVSDGTDTLSIKLAKDLSGLTSATFDSGVKIGKDGIDAGSKTITGVATPVNGTDAANKDYVDSTAASSDTHVKSGTYAVATSGTDKNTVTLDMVKGNTDLTDKVTITGVATTADLKNLSGDTTNAVLYDGTAKDTVTLAGASGTTITNVAKGVNDTDAVNYSQIKDLVNTDGSTKTLTFAANSGTAFKSNPDSTITVKGTGTKDDSNYSSENIKTTVDADGNITVMMDKDISAGTIGVAGKDGKDGVTIYATDGKDGSEGHIGLTGPAGADGKNATADISVKDGAAGVDGTTLTRVVYEDRNGTEHQVATLDDGMKYDGDTGTGLAMKLNSTVNVKGGVTDETKLSDNNIGVVSDGTDTLNIKLAKDLTGLTSVTSDTVTADTIKAGDTVTLSKDGIDAGSKTITNVASGSNDGDAVNYSQIKDLVNTDGSTKTLTFAANSGTAFKSSPDSTITVKGTGTKDDSNYSSDNIKTTVDANGNITVMMDKDISAGTIGVAGKDGKDGVTIYATDGKDGSEGHIGLTGPAGADGKNATADISVKDGAAGVDGTTLTRVVYEDRNGTEHQVATLDDGMKYAGDSGTGLSMKLNSTVNVKGGVTDTANLSDNNIGVVSDGTDTLNIKLAKDLTGLTSVSADTIKAGDTVTLSKDGIDAGSKTITNVASGSNDTDAVNYSQIKNLVNSDGSTKTLTFAANSGTAFKSNPDSTITVKGTGTKDDSNYSSDNIKTTVDADGNITVMMDKDISAGTIGVAGKDGKDGVTIYATDGKDGSEGHIGLTGPAGADGKNATADISVKDGAAGVDGTTLTRVVYEDRNGTEHQVATLDDGMKYAGDTGTGLAMKLNSTVNVKGGVTDETKLSDGNIGVVSDGTDTLNIKLAKDLTGLTSVTSDTVTADTIKAGDTVTLSKDGIDAGSKTITNVASGSNDGDAVNYSQIKDLVNSDGSTKTLTFAANSGTAFKSNPDSTITVKGTGTKDDSNYSSDNIKTVVDANGNITVMMDKELTSDTVIVGQDGKDGTIGVNGADGISGVGIDGKDGISIKGADGKDGVTIYSKDGADGSEGHIGLTGPAGTDGKNATADISVKDGAAGVDGTTLTRVVYEDRNGTEHQVATLDDGMKYDGDTGTGLAMKLNSTVNVKGGVTDETKLSDNNIGVVSDGTDTLNIKLAKDLTGLTSVTSDTVTADTIKAGDTVTLSKDGIDAGSKTITNVASGSNDGDAVNYSQIKDLVNTDGSTKTLTFAANSGTAFKSSPDSTITVKGTGTKDDSNYSSDNIKTTVDANGNITVMMDKDISAGTIGVAGKDGKDGVTIYATDGKDGSEGHIGLTGPAGADGKNATADISVKDGAAGVDGTTLTRVVYEDRNGTEHQVATLDDGMKYAGDSGTGLSMKLNSTVNVKGGVTDTANLSDNNIGVVSDGTDTLNIKLAKDLIDLNSATFGSGSSAVTISSSGIDNGGNKISNVANGTEAGDAVNYSQLQAVSDKIDTAGTEAAKHSSVTASDSNITVTTGTNENGGTDYKVGLSDSVNVNKDLTVGTDSATQVKLDGETGTITAGKVTVDGSAGTVTGLTNTTWDADNITSGQAATEDQLKQAVSSVTQEAKDSDTHVKEGTYTASDGTVTMDLVNGKGESTGSQVIINDVASKAQQDTNTTNINNGWNAQIDGTTVNNVTPSNNNMNFVTGDNIVLSNSDNGIKISTSKNISVDTVKVGDKVSISSDGIDAGGTKVTNIAEGDVTATSTDAVNGSQLYSVEQKIDSTYGDTITKIGNSVNKLGDRVDKVGAGAAALAALHPLDFDPDDKWDFAAGYGHYNGKNAASVGAFYRPNEDTMFSVGASVGNGENMINAGVSFKLGQGNHVSTSRVAMAKEIIDMRNQMKQMSDMMHSMLKTIDPTKSAEFPDVPENHWAYEYVSKLAGNGIVEGYPDGNFKGDRTMTRYEMAAMLYRALEKGVNVDGRMLKEFQPELERIRVDRVSNAPIDRVRVIKGQG